MKTIENAVARSIDRSKSVKCEFAGDWKSLKAHVADTFAHGNDAIFIKEPDGTIDVTNIDSDWRVQVTLIDAD